MLKYFLVSAAILFSASGCKKDEESDPWPVWILNVRAMDAYSPRQPVQGCPSVQWHYHGSSSGGAADCRYDNLVKVGASLEHDVVVDYQVFCDGYEPSELQSTSFYLLFSYQGQGRDGSETIENVVVYLTPL